MLPARQRTVVLLVAAVQFVNILDFVMVTPLGPFLSSGLGVPASALGLVSASYTGAAAVAGVGGSLFLDRFDRKRALVVSLLGLMTATALGGLARDLPELLLARVLAGLFGGPATSVSMAIVADVVPPAQRGKAMGIVMSAFSAATVLGVPAGLVLAEQGGWRMPFFGVGAIGLIIAAATAVFLPPLRGHLIHVSTHGAVESMVRLVAKPNYRFSWMMTALVMGAGFLVIPNFPAFLTLNAHFPQSGIKYLYALGGFANFFMLQAAGRLVDRFGAFKVGLGGSWTVAGLVLVYFVWLPAWLPVTLSFVLFMLAMGLRNVAHSTLTSKVPLAPERARFQSVQSAVQHAASALGSGLSAGILTLRPDGTLGRMWLVGLLASALSLLAPLLFQHVEKTLTARTA